MKFLTTVVFLVLATFSSVSYAVPVGNANLQTQEFVYDFAVNGGATGFKDLSSLGKRISAGAVIVDMYYRVDVAPTSGGSATIALGDVNDNDRYKAATAYNDAAYALNFVAKAAQGVPANITAADIGKMGILIETATLTAGKIKFLVSFYQPKR